MTTPQLPETDYGILPQFETQNEWVDFEHGWHVCSYCGDTSPEVRPESVRIGGHTGTQQRYRCATAHPVYGWVYGHQEVA